MKTRREFAIALGSLALPAVDLAVALLWYYQETQQFDERSASALADDLRDEGFSRPNVTRLDRALKKSKLTVRGRQPGTYQIATRAITELEDRLLPLLEIKRVAVVGAILPPDLTAGTRLYIEKLAHQINATYEYHLFDASAVLCRRLVESLLIEVYVSRNRQAEIQSNGVFYMLDRIVTHIKGDTTIPKSRSFGKVLDEVKAIGDTAAHDRTYLTQQIDLDDLKARYRKLISELLTLSGIRP